MLNFLVHVASGTTLIVAEDSINESVLPSFKWLSWQGFLIGLIKSFLYGAYAGLVYVPIYNFLHGKWMRQ